MSWVAVGIGVGAGVLKNYAIDQPAANRQRKLAGQTQAFSPWTGLKADAPQDPNVMGNMLSMGSQAAMLGQGIKNAGAQKDLMEAQSSWLNRGGSPMYTQAVGGSVPGGAGGWGSYGPSSPMGLPMNPNGQYNFGTSGF